MMPFLVHFKTMTIEGSKVEKKIQLESAGVVISFI